VAIFLRTKEAACSYKTSVIFYNFDVLLYTEDCIMDVDYYADCTYCTDTPELTLTRSNFSQDTIECMYGQLFVYRQWSPAEIQTQTYWNLTGHGMLVPLPVISPSSILHPPLSHYAFVPTRKNEACVAKMLLFQFLCALLKIVSV